MLCVSEVRMKGLGGWVGGWCNPSLMGAPNLRHTQSLQCGRAGGLERVPAPLRCVGIADFKTQWNNPLKMRGGRCGQQRQQWS